MEDTPLQITKMDAAHRQIRAAIRMWFTEEDPVAIHTLIAAAHELLHTLFKRKGLSGLIFDSPIIREEYRGDAAKRIKAPATFFKHSQRDPDAVIDFYPRMNELLLFACVHALGRMDEPNSLEYDSLLWWIWVHYPKFFPADTIRYQIPTDVFQDVTRTSRKEFFEICNALWRAVRMPSQISRGARERP
jgi:hypothetical protein